jgi:hypothetical protein
LMRNGDLTSRSMIGLSCWLAQVNKRAYSVNRIALISQDIENLSAS